MRLQRDIEAAASSKVWISIGTKPLWSLVRGAFHWVASAAASAALRILPRYLPWLRCDALHPSAADATRVARPNQCFPRCFTCAHSESLATAATKATSPG